MKLFISHNTALSYWREHFPLDSEIGNPAKISTSESCAYLKSDILAFIPEAWIEPGQPVDVLVFNPSERRQSRSIRCHAWVSSIPDGSFFRDRDVHVSSPEFLFLQMASRLSIHKLIALGCELCGTYTLLPKDRQHPSAIDDHPTRIAPLTNIQKISDFLDASQGAKGVRKARRALRYIAEGSRSPMETMVYMLLCLPPLLGGYGLPKASLNPDIPLDSDAQMIAQRMHAYGDVCWPDQHLDIEYHGDIHTGTEKMHEDVGRTLGIESMGWRVMTLTSPQVFDWTRFETVAKEAAAYLKFRLYPRVMGATPQRLTLHEELESWMFTI